MKNIQAQNPKSSVVLRVEHLFKRFGHHVALKNVSFELMKGDILGIIGPSGGGKTTLLRCLNLLERFDSGSIEFLGKTLVMNGDHGDLLNCTDGDKVPLHEVTECQIRRDVGIVFQGFNLWEEKTVLDNIMLGPIVVLKSDPAIVKSRAFSLCQQFGLAEKMEARVWQLSGGQRQRVAIIRALMMDPKILLLDEVTSALDPILTAGILDVIRQLQRQGMTMVLVTHHIEFASNICNRLMYLSDGEALQIDTPANLRNKPASHEIATFLDILRSIR